MFSRRAALVALLWMSSALADPEKNKIWRRELDGHVFFPSLAMPDPFVSTYVSLNLGAGYAWIDGPGFDVRGNTVGGGSYTAAALAEGLLFQAGVTRWLALRVGGAGGLNGGDNARSALEVGLVSPLVAQVGLTASWPIGKMVRLGGVFDFVYTYAKLIQPLNAVRNSLAAGMVDTTGVSQKINGYQVAPGISLAVSPHRLIGLGAVAQYLWNGLYGDVSSRSLNYFVLGVSSQLDFRALSERAPVGLSIGYRAQIPFESGTRYTHTLEGAIFYTGKREIDFGLDLQVRWFDLRADSRRPLDARQLVSVFLLRYHWN